MTYDNLEMITDEELAAYAAAASAMRPALPWAGRAILHSYKEGGWYEKIDKDTTETIGATETFVFDRRSLGERYMRWGILENGKRGVTDKIGGLFKDGWRNPPRSELPEYDRKFWPLNKEGKPEDPWVEEIQLTMRHVESGQLYTWCERYFRAEKTIGSFLDICLREARNYPGEHPVGILGSEASGKYFSPVLNLIGEWQPFGEGASPPPDPLRHPRLLAELKALQLKYSAENVVALKSRSSSGQRGGMDDYYDGGMDSPVSFGDDDENPDPNARRRQSAR